VESRVHQAVVAAVLALSALSPHWAGAVERDVDADTRNSAVELRFTRRDGAVHVDARDSGGTESACRWGVQPFADDPVALGKVTTVPSRPNNESRLYLITCNGVFDHAQWIGPQNTVDIDAIAYDLAEQEVRRVTVVPLEININPPDGLTGVESWFWTEGYAGDPIAAQVGAFGINVSVNIVPSSVTWDFGDGSPPIQGDFGRAYPERSTVTHAYTDRSASGPYTVTATFEFRPTFSIDGGPPQELPPIQRTYTTQYLVREAQAVID
jgi:hypothetical protein